MPEAFNVGARLLSSDDASSCPRSSVPFDFFSAVFLFAPLGTALAFFSSSANIASFSAFVRAASAAFSAAASL